PCVAFDETELTTTRLELGFGPRAGLGEFGYLSGTRADASVSQELRLKSVALDAGYQFRSEDIGTYRSSCPFPCPATSIEPFGYAGSGGWLSSRAEPGGGLWPELSGGAAGRHHRAANGVV